MWAAILFVRTCIGTFCADALFLDRRFFEVDARRRRFVDGHGLSPSFNCVGTEVLVSILYDQGVLSNTLPAGSKSCFFWVILTKSVFDARDVWKADRHVIDQVLDIYPLRNDSHSAWLLPKRSSFTPSF